MGKNLNLTKGDELFRYGIGSIMKYGALGSAVYHLSHYESGDGLYSVMFGGFVYLIGDMIHATAKFKKEELKSVENLEEKVSE